MNFKLPAGALLVCAALLSGCTSMAERRAQLKQYDDSLSYAMNVSRQFWRPQFKDTKVPEGKAVSNSTLGADVTLDAMSWLAGSRSLPGSFGLDLGMSILGDMAKEKPFDMQPHVLAYVDAARFPNRKDAELEAVAQVYAAVKKGLADTGFTIARSVEAEHASFLWTKSTYAGADFDNPKLGCQSREQLGDHKNWKGKVCWVDVRFKEHDEDELPATDIPSWMKKGGSKAWPMSVDASVVWNLADDAKIDAATLFAATAKYLPDNYWIYIEPQKIEGKKGYTPPYLIDNKGVHFYVTTEKVAANK